MMGGQASTPAPWPPAGSSGELATFAGGCFWSVELAFQRVPGVLHTAVGYTAGHKDNPTYQEVCSGRTGHTEAVQLLYDKSQVPYETLVRTLFNKIDSTTLNQQGNDRGTQYRSGIYYHNDEQRRAAEAAAASIPGCVTEVLPAGRFWPAEGYHQQYLEKGSAGRGKQSAAKMCSDPIRCYG